ncbi:serine-rich adhesin for platelets [Octopus bimaculoides]|uniref:RING-type domain-containing protein n=1 Tax=Octopus bimaculoides TaxID=37653 RepID=A0A0L8IAM1_OCTBM|nr:serine-rich adhesin for platelets [Octopus bimaculoides]|eukprot:XP_014784913.1 PREDICTED: serine-rich adhesin for platelets-like [Octopus bimaculoides]
MATNMKLMKEINEQFLVCKICYEAYKNPKTLTCLHTFCSNCLQKHVDSEQERTSRYTLYSRHVYCPICRKKTEIPTGGIRRLPDNFLVSNLTDVLNRLKTTKVQPCEICHTVRSRSNEACSKCLECSKLMCKSCVKLHMTTKVTQNHSLFDLEGEKDIECKAHSGEIMRFYCEPCDECVCVVCTFQEHRDHEICSFSEGSAKYKSTIENLLSHGKDRLIDLRMKLGMINKCEGALKDTRERIRDLAISYISQVRQTEKQLLQKVDAMFGDEILDFLENKSWLQENFDNLQNTCSLAEIIVKDKGIEILLLKKELQKKLDVLLQPDLPEVPQHLATNIKFVPGFVKLGHISVPGREEEDVNITSEKEANCSAFNRSMKHIDMQTDCVTSMTSSTTMSTYVNRETAASQTSKIEMVNRLAGTDTNHTRDKSTEVYWIDPKSRGTMTDPPQSRSRRSQTFLNDDESITSICESLKKNVPTESKSMETEVSISSLDDVSTEDLMLLQRAKESGLEIQSLLSPSQGPADKQPARTEEKGTGEGSVLTSCASINTDKVLICDRKVSSHLSHDSGSCSPVGDRKSRRLSADILALQQKFSEPHVPRYQDNGKSSPSSPSTPPTPTRSSGRGSPESTQSRNGQKETRNMETDTSSLLSSQITTQGTSTDAVETASASTEVKPATNSVGVSAKPKYKDTGTGDQILTLEEKVFVDGETSPINDLPGILFEDIERSTNRCLSATSASKRSSSCFSDVCTETDSLKMRDSQTLTSVLETVDNWTLTNRTEFINTATSPILIPMCEVGVSTLNPVLVSQGMSTEAVEHADSQTETNIFTQDSETLTDRVISTDAQTNIHIHSEDSQTWIDCSTQSETGTMTETDAGTSTIEDFLLLAEGEPSGDIANISEVIDSDQGASEDDIFFELTEDDDDRMMHQCVRGWNNTMTLLESMENHNTSLCNKCCLQKPIEVAHRATMSSPTLTHDQGTMVLSFNTALTEFTDRNVQTIQTAVADKSIEAAFSDPPGNSNLVAAESNDVATSTESLAYMGLMSEVDINDLYLLPDSAFDLHSDTDTANSEYDSDTQIEMVDSETSMENSQSVEAGTQTPMFTQCEGQSLGQEPDPQTLLQMIDDDDSKHLVSIGVNTVRKVTYEKETSTQSRYLFSKGTMTFYLNKSDKATGSNRSSIASRNSLLIDRVDKDTMTCSSGTSEKGVSTDSSQLNEQVAVCINKLRNVRDKLQSPTSKQAPEIGELSPKSSLARKNKPELKDLLGSTSGNNSTLPMSGSVDSVGTVSATTLGSEPCSLTFSTLTTPTTTRPKSSLFSSPLLAFSSTSTSLTSSGHGDNNHSSSPTTATTTTTTTTTAITMSCSVGCSTTLLTTMASSNNTMSTSLSSASPLSDNQRISERTTTRKAQPITTLKCRYKDVNAAANGLDKSQTLPRQFSAPTNDLQLQQQQQQQAGLLNSSPSRLPLLRYNSAPGKIVTVPKHAPPKDLSVSPQTSPKSTSKIPTTRKLNESQKDTIKDYYTITNAKPTNQLPSLPAITETRTPPGCSDPSGLTTMSNCYSNSMSDSCPAQTFSTLSPTCTSLTADDTSVEPASPATGKRNTLATPDSPCISGSSRECSPQTRKTGFMQRLLTRKPKKDTSNDSNKRQQRHHQRPDSSPASVSTSSSSSALSINDSKSATPSPKSPPKSGLRVGKKSMSPSPTSSSKTPSTNANSNRPTSAINMTNSSSPASSAQAADDKTAKSKKSRPFVYMRQRIFSIQHDNEDSPERRARALERQKKNEKKTEKKKTGSSATDGSNSSSSPGLRRDRCEENGKNGQGVIKTNGEANLLTVEGQSFADVC